MQLYTIGEVADILKVKKETVGYWVRNGKIKAFKLVGNKHTRITPEALEEFVNQRNKQ